MHETQKWKESSVTPPETSSVAPDRHTSMDDTSASGIDYEQELAKLRQELARLGDVVSGSLQNTVRPMARELEGIIVRNPTTSVAVAAGAGLLLGIMMKR